MTRLTALFAVLVLLTACAASGGAPSESSPPPESGQGSSGTPEPSDEPESGGGEIDHPEGDAAILVISSAGGMLPVNMQVTQVPMLVVTGDGRVVMQGAQTLEFPGPALPPLVERRLSEEGVQAVLDALDGTNLFTSDLELRGMSGMVADASDTIFTVNAAGLESTVTVYALGMLMPDMEPPPGMDAAEVEAYEVLSTLNERLMTMDAWLPADAWETDTWVPYEPSAFRLYVRDVTDQPVDQELPGQELAWPTDDDPATFGEEITAFADGTRCAVVEGDAASTWFAALSEANQNTVWTSGDRRYSVAPRPLLPHEEPVCPELDAAS